MSDQISVTIADEHLQDIDALADQLRGAGMKIDQIQHAIGVITGAATAAGRSAIAQVPGVLAVDEQAAYQLPPPDAEIQ